MTGKQSLVQKLRAQWVLLCMLVPGVVYYVLYRYVPIFMGVLLSVKKYNMQKGVWGSPFASPFFEHFMKFFQSTYCFRLISNTLVLSATKMLLGLPIAVLLALMLYECSHVRLRKLIQTISYLPHFLSWVVIYGMCFLLFSESTGIVNVALRLVGAAPIQMFTSPDEFFWLIVLSDVWKATGWSAIIYMAAITDISPNLYEAAKIDGASKRQALCHITIPCIIPVIVLTLILRCGSILDAGFEQILIMYNPTVRSSVDIIDTWVYRSGLENFNISLASAVGLFKSVVSFVLVVAVNLIAKKGGNELW